MTQDNHSQQKTCAFFYAAYILSMLMQFSFSSALAGSAIIMIALIACYFFRKKYSGTLVASHYHWLIRTFWIGGTVWLPIITILGAVVIFFMIDLSPIHQAIQNGDMLSQVEILQIILEKNGPLLQYSFLSLTGFFSIWWIWRCAKGLQLLLNQQTLPEKDLMRWI